MDKDLLLEAYRMALTLCLHEDNRRASILRIFMWTQVAVFALYAWGEQKQFEAVHIFLYAAAAVNLMFSFMLERTRATVLLRVFYMKTIEDKIPELQMFSVESRVRSQKHAKIGEHEIRLGRLQRISLSKMESSMPLIASIFWIILALYSHK